MLALVDCNSCYASCEQIFRPDLRGQPVVVLSNNDGCIVARNKEAKALAIPDLEPFFKIRHLLEQQGVQVFSSNYALYGNVSARVMSILAEWGNAIEIYSIDEAFLDVTGYRNLLVHGEQIRKVCWQQQRMPVSVGIAPTKTLAKLANHIAKKSNRLQGVCVMEESEQWDKVLQKIAVGKVWGVGRRIARRLTQEWGIDSVYALKKAPVIAIQEYFGVTLGRTIRELNGEPCLTLETQPPPKKQIFSSRSFAQKVKDLQALEQSVAFHAGCAAEKLRVQHSLASAVYVMIETSRFADRPYRNSQVVSLSHATNDSRQIVTAARDALHSLFRPGYAYAKVGVGLLDLTEEVFHQGDLFQARQDIQSRKLMTAMDQLNRRFGKGHVYIARQGHTRRWDMARQFLSPAYMTRIEEIPLIRVGS